MVIAFTGHRNKSILFDSLMEILSDYPDAVWCHGGAAGFDSQVSEFCEKMDIEQVIIKPDYARNGRPAPLIRNREIVDMADVVFACYDGRKTGGTAYTINYAKKQGKPVHVLSPI